MDCHGARHKSGYGVIMNLISSIRTMLNRFSMMAAMFAVLLLIAAGCEVQSGPADGPDMLGAGDFGEQPEQVGFDQSAAPDAAALDVLTDAFDLATTSLCGDGVVDPGEECDDGGANVFEPGACRPDCTLPVCGDGILDGCWVGGRC